MIDTRSPEHEVLQCACLH